MHFLQPTTCAEALEAMAALPRGLPVAGGTDVMVELNFHRRHPEALIDLGRIQGLGEMSERFLEEVLSEHGLWEAPRPLGDAVKSKFAHLVMLAAGPADDVRGTAAYRTRALRVLAGRILDWVWADYLKAGPG